MYTFEKTATGWVLYWGPKPSETPKVVPIVALLHEIDAQPERYVADALPAAPMAV